MERRQQGEHLSESLVFNKQRENSLRYRLGRSAASAVLATSAISFPVQSTEPQLATESFTQSTHLKADFHPLETTEKQEIVAYDHTFDFKAYEALKQLPKDIRDQEKERLDAYTDKQLQTILGERLNVLTSTFYYDMKDGNLWGQDMNEPALTSYKRGRDYRRAHGNPIDFKREDSEIEGFQKIEEMLREGKSVLSISPKGSEGSIYQHNFYDVFMWKNGKIEVKRFSSGLSIEDYKKMFGLKGEFKDSDFLASPIDITGIFETAEEVHGSLHVDHVITDTDFFENVVLPSTMQQRHGALKALFEGDEYGFAINFNGMFNLADDLVLEHNKNPNQTVFVSPVVLSDFQIAELGQREVEKKEVGCGTSSGVKLFKNLATSLVEEAKFSVKDFGDKNEECEHCKQTSADNHYHCPGCGKAYKDETNKSPEARTKVCNELIEGGTCGFKFGC